MPNEERIEQGRRQLVQALTLGMLSGGIGWNAAAQASWFGKLPRKIAEGKSIFDFGGEVWVNGVAATLETPIRAGDTITTGKNGHVVLAIGDTALALRGKSQLETGGRDLLVTGLRLLSGGMLSVFGKRREPIELRTPTATIGIRGTGVYSEVDAEKTYLCTCYGTTDIASAVDAKERTQITATHHDAAKYVLNQPEKGQRIIAAPFINHTDIELMTLEALVGRKVPFEMPAADYEAPRREY